MGEPIDVERHKCMKKKILALKATSSPLHMHRAMIGYARECPPTIGSAHNKTCSATFDDGLLFDSNGRFGVNANL